MMLTLERLREVLSYDPATGIFTWLVQLAPRGKVGAEAGHRTKGPTNIGRRQIRIDGVLYLAHRLAWFYVHGEWPKVILDHKNVDPSYNAINNLRLANSTLNQINSRAPKTNTSGVKGVHWDQSRGKWAAFIRINCRQTLLGRFPTKELAAAAYLNAAIKHYGEFARAA